MIGLASSVILGGLLLVLLLLWWKKATVSGRELPSQWEALPYEEPRQREGCPAEIVSNIFSRDDREFVANLQSAFLEKLFRAERKSLALCWVQQTSQGIQRIMREHTELTRRSADLEFATEMKIFFRYAELRLVCGLLLLSIELAGPFWLRGLAIYANNVSQRLGQTHDALLAAAEPKEIRRINSY